MARSFTAVLSEAWAKLRDWASVAGRGWLLLSGSIANASLKTAVLSPKMPCIVGFVDCYLRVPMVCQPCCLVRCCQG